jgi:hypothetical protein
VALDTGDDSDRHATLDRAPVVGRAHRPEVEADLGPDHEIGAAALQLSRLAPQRADRGVRISVQLDPADVRLHEADGARRRSLLKRAHALDSPEAVACREENRPSSSEKRAHGQSLAACHCEKRVGSGAVDQGLQRGEQQRAAEIRDLHSGKERRSAAPV